MYQVYEKASLSMRAKTSIAQRMPADYEDETLQFYKFVINAGKQLVLNWDK